ncbi:MULTISPECIES: acetate--CoA ligase [Sphingobacterium]|uniref:Acetate--CoA ligase n=1 Tax=Sphingobacterium multivorum TaxID=28454 RepID=A0A654A6V1_SPHMU|nr:MULTISPECIES: acetate--CoA ligase [Sphingobacterium]HBI89437.1 acetate--CoA ligase [Sphingobacterium sp.]KKO93338.1 acetyl-CoA synthetase [Sphingobacterium sp. Ag1]QQT42869.1 acetate--CoA ligase [Sphingobacterium multivorum]SUJ01923.1 Acetyl-coenzyme A synthetase [Sphingobacterium multivorum]VXC63281.1 acetyl-CoA synthetase [Sphingobacterium multivorum]
MSLQIKSFEEYQSEYKRSVEQPEEFWASIADHFFWKRKWNKVLNWNFEEPNVKWFEGAKLNITENCLDRHIYANGDKPAIIWEPNDPNEAHRILSYKQLLQKVEQFANVLKNNNIKKGDRVCIYLPMVPELVIAVLACARIGAIHSVVFGGFSARSIADRIVDAECKLIVTSDGSYRGNKTIGLKNIVDDALMQCDTVEKVIVLTRTRTPVSMIKGRDVWWEDEIKKVETQGNPACPAEEMDAEDNLFILYTSGSTGKPKGVVHTCGGYMVYTGYTFMNTFQYKPNDVFFCTADIGWITGHSYIVYGPLSQGATSLMFEGIPTFPDASRYWDIVDKFKVNIIYTSPTALRSLMAFGDEFVDKNDLSSLRVLGSVGEPINEEAWNWFNEKVGKKNCPIVDTYWQTENGGHLITSLAGVTPEKASYAMFPMPGIQPALMDENGKEIEGNDVTGNLCIKFPWPGMLRTTWGDHDRCRQTYFSTYKDMYFTGDGCFRSPEGYYKITGRVDDVLNVSGHRIGTAEVENAINMHADVVESAIVGYPHPVKGQGIYAYVIANHHTDAEATKKDIMETVSRIIGPIAKPDIIQFVDDLPKTRSGKIMRRILRKIAEDDIANVGDTSTLQDPAVVEGIIKGAAALKK